MPECPKCEKEIDTLSCPGSVDAYYEVRLLADGMDLEYNEVSSTSEKGQKYECPECGEEIIEGYEKAVAFLKGEGKD
jgi:hypothetical protein